LKVGNCCVDYRLSEGLLIVDDFRLAIAVVAELTVVTLSATVLDHMAWVIRVAVICHPIHYHICNGLLTLSRLRTTLKVDRLSYAKNCLNHNRLRGS